MKALSLTRPWPYTILHLGKRIENRMRKDGKMPYICRHRGPLLLHAAKSWDNGVEQWVEDRGLLHAAHLLGGHEKLRLSVKKLHPTGIVGRCRVVGAVRSMGDGSGRFEEYDFDSLHRPDELDMRWWRAGTRSCSTTWRCSMSPSSAAATSGCGMCPTKF